MAAVLVLASCTGPAGPPAGASGSPAATPTRSPGSGPAPADTPSLRRVSWDWHVLGRGPDTDQRSYSSSYDGRYLVAELGSTDTAVAVVDTARGGTVAHLRVPGGRTGWRIVDVWLDAPWLLVVADHGEAGPGARAYRFDLRDGSRVELTALPRLPAPADAHWSYADGTAAYLHLDPRRRRSCLVLLDVPALTWRTRTCTRAGFTSWPVLAAGDLVYRLQGAPAGGRQPCVRLFHIRLDGTGAPVRVPLRRPCRGFSGVAAGGVLAWSEVGLHAAAVGRSPAYALAGGRVVGLGVVETGSLTACGGWVYWQRPPTGPGEGEALLRWRPGSPRQLVLTTRGATVLALQRCAAGWVTVSRDDLDAGRLTALAARPPAAAP